MKFYKCQHCGQVVVKVVDSSVPMICCGEEMEELVANSTDAAGEKHVPVVRVEGNHVHVEVGSVAHPMLDVHWICWVALETNQGYSIVHLNPGDAPAADFVLREGEEVKQVYEYCNLHGLWKTQL